ncbi:N-acetylmuramoyl-L-alanine amidase family protein [Alkaliphilus sp. B6464]|uniref:N-acetylmuramoyl-L-alanine amidase family protein n=1 Tax=Alkaliphilus sp. B6464 TaxID=2731219 RepID=UPI001BA92815|nr:N-acetylmuramoyl-L-alanine amidase family protein [Alkaliphilus sp. B6464]QUH20323.1 N-acetylmuramoyl-L-alanine amidase [Alkaliphilus sp. B6464]
MKKLISSILVLIIFIASFTTSFANVSTNKISLKENGKVGSFQVVNLKIDNKVVKSVDVPPVLYLINNQARTLVPLRMIVEHLEDKLNADIEWDQAKYEVKVKTNDKEIILKIDSPIATVNGVQKKLPDNIPAKLLTLGSVSRTMVPIRFFAEELGLNVEWDQETWTALIDIPTAPEDESEKEPIPPQENVAEITDVRIEMNDSTPQVRIKTSKKADYKQFKLTNPERLVIDVADAKFNLSDKNKLENNGTLNIPISSDVIKGVRVSQFQNDPFITRVVVDLGKLVESEITLDEKNGEIVIDFVKNTSNDKERLIVIDPGHGGKDPGAISSTLKLHEAEIVLDIAIRLNKLLTGAGFKTYMTRVDDRYVSLQDRVDTANKLNADLFVSIHANAALTNTANGLENFYYPSEKNPLDNRDNKKLAQIFQDEMIKNLNINSRGAKAGDLYVLRNTTMPAVLTETGFLTNAGDEAKLATSQYRQQVAEAMFKSTVRYFEETK